MNAKTAQLMKERAKAQQEYEDAMDDQGPLSMNESSSAERYRQIKNSGDKAKVAAAFAQAKKDSALRVQNGRKLEAAIKKVKELDRKITDAAD